MVAAYLDFWRNYLNFWGRATRMQYWVPMIINWVIALMLLGQGEQYPTLRYIAAIFSLILIFPTWTVIIRRVRDTGVKHMFIWGWLAIVFSIVAFILALFPSDAFKR